MSQIETKSKVETNIFLKEPTLFKLIYINDNQTSQEFVIHTLVDIFNYTEATAENLTLDVHETGSAVVAGPVVVFSLSHSTPMYKGPPPPKFNNITGLASIAYYDLSVNGKRKRILFASEFHEFQYDFTKSHSSKQ